jgi:hypothetical protein
MSSMTGRGIEIGDIIWRWTVVGGPILEPRPNGKHRLKWQCQCSCGSVRLVAHDNLVRGGSKSCGCLTRIHVRPGDHYSRFTVLSQETSTTWLCRCQCGTLRSVDQHHLVSADWKSCGCLSRELTRKRSKPGSTCVQQLGRHERKGAVMT